MSADEERMRKEEERLMRSCSKPGGKATGAHVASKPAPVAAPAPAPVSKARPASEARNFIDIEEENKKKKHEEEEAKKASLRLNQATGELLDAGQTHLRDGVDSTSMSNMAAIDVSEALKLEEQRLNRNMVGPKEPDQAELDRKQREKEEAQKHSAAVNAKAQERLRQWEAEQAKKDVQKAAQKAAEEEEARKKLAAMNIGNLLGQKLFTGN